MFRNYLKTTIRALRHNRTFSVINIAGLTMGLTVCILIGLFAWDENQYDKNVPGGENVYRIYAESTNQDGSRLMAVTPPMFATTLQNDFAEVEQTARVLMRPETKVLFESNNKQLYESGGLYVDSTFFNVFPLSFQYGSSINVLNDANAVVISNEMSKRFFSNENPLGQQMLIDKHPYLVKGVFVRDPKFHLQFDYALPLAAAHIPAAPMKSWGWHQFLTYVKLKSAADIKATEKNFQADVKRKAIRPANQAKTEDIPYFQPLEKIHLYSSNFKFDIAQRGNITYVNALIIIAIFVLLIACFNFINLATAKSLKRAREVGVRKSIGANKTQLMVQFVGESIFMSLIGIVLSAFIAVACLPRLNSFTDKHIPIGLLLNPIVLLLLFALALVVGLLAGFYPALVLSGFKPVKVLKGNFSGTEQGKNLWLRHSLVITQFTLSILLIISAIIVFQQTDYLHNKDLGLNKDQIMFFPMRGKKMEQNVDAFKNELLRSPGVASVSIGYGFPGDAVAGDEIIVPHNGERTTQSATQLMVDFDYVKTLNLQVIAGRDFSKTMLTDKDHAFIINETAVTQLGFKSPQNAIGQKLEWNPWGAKPDSFKTGEVIGVVKDFNYKSLYDKVETTILQIFPDAAWKVAVKIKSTDMNEAIAHVTKVWNQFTPEYPIEYKFLDENFSKMYTSEDKLKALLEIFTGIAIFVGCLGLFGLAAYSAERRKKEVGIRKVLGASTESLIFLLSNDFLRLVGMSILIASPIAWYFMHRWLQDFAYRINISWWVFIMAAVISISIALITVSFQAIKAALANPVRSLRTE